MPDEGSFSTRYFESNLPQPSNNSRIDAKSKDTNDRLRFGIPIAASYGNTGTGVNYGNSNGVGYMISPMKIDIGGVALGALIGLGAILVVPKLAHIFSGGYGYRSLENEMGSLTDVLARVDNTLEQHNIDSSSCMQRVICSYVHDAQKNIKMGEANSVDEFIYALTNNSLLSYMLDGSTVKQAIDMGKSGDTEKCSSLYTKCPISKENIAKVVASLLPA
ncbi:uncharacterized protein LOC109609314 [Aethina tumida]|uniref:uncharacterized protein LOC109609314 n=1 Tax=Aethina tumida TaxID=116153 RepID=UPI002147ED2E|nr:uncharacterized protein LOC109609314 [Aethina tumida]